MGNKSLSDRVERDKCEQKHTQARRQCVRAADETFCLLHNVNQGDLRISGLKPLIRDPCRICKNSFNDFCRS